MILGCILCFIWVAFVTKGPTLLCWANTVPETQGHWMVMIHRHGGSERWRRLLVCMYDGNVTAGFRLPTVDKYLGSLAVHVDCLSDISLTTQRGWVWRERTIEDRGAGRECTNAPLILPFSGTTSTTR